MTVLAISFALASCGDSMENRSKRAFRDLVEAEGGKLVSFKKTNGQERNLLGVQAYSVSYEAEVEYPNGRVPECIRPKLGQNVSCLALSVQGIKPIPAGGRDKSSGVLNFEKTEKGWRAANGKIY